MDLARLKELVDLAAASPIGALDIEEAGYRVRIRRVPADAPDAGVAPASAAPVARARAMAAPRPAAAAPAGAHDVASPMYGIFHRAPSPDSPPFVEPGARVKRGDRLCLVEAMKVFNVVEADADGVVAEILPRNGDEVEPGQVLFRIAR